MAIIKRRIKKSLLCPLTKRFESVMVCALDCRKKCALYEKNVTVGALEKLIEKYPDYEIVGEFMARKPLDPNAKKKTEEKKEKSYWVITGENQYKEVLESEIVENPKEYLGQRILDKPPYEYELIVSLRKKK